MGLNLFKLLFLASDRQLAAERRRKKRRYDGREREWMHACMNECRYWLTAFCCSSSFCSSYTCIHHQAKYTRSLFDPSPSQSPSIHPSIHDLFMYSPISFSLDCLLIGVPVLCLHHEAGSRSRLANLEHGVRKILHPHFRGNFPAYTFSVSFNASSLSINVHIKASKKEPTKQPKICQKQKKST